MADAPPPHTSQRRRPHGPPMAAPYLEFDLVRELERLHAEPDWNNGLNARTLVKYENLRVVLMALESGAQIPEHQTKGRISIQTIVGHILVRAEGRTFDLPVGTLLALDEGLPHDVEALEESAFLLTIGWPSQR
jgi:quercetin dioxygenase-like cupin family protein